MADFLDAWGCGCGYEEKSYEQRASEADVPVWLHVYDVGHAHIIQELDHVLQDFCSVGGVFHGAVEVYGVEWSFGGTRRPVSGVFACKPKKCTMHTYKQSIFMGDCKKTPAEAHAILARLRGEWMGPSYDLLRRNCCSFSNELCIALGVGPIPPWTHRLADAGAALSDARRAELEALHNVEDRVANALCMDVAETDTRHFLETLEGMGKGMQAAP